MANTKQELVSNVNYEGDIKNTARFIQYIKFKYTYFKTKLKLNIVFRISLILNFKCKFI